MVWLLRQPAAAVTSNTNPTLVGGIIQKKQAIVLLSVMRTLSGSSALQIALELLEFLFKDRGTLHID